MPKTERRSKAREVLSKVVPPLTPTVRSALLKLKKKDADRKTADAAFVSTVASRLAAVLSAEFLDARVAASIEEGREHFVVKWDTVFEFADLDGCVDPDGRAFEKRRLLTTTAEATHMKNAVAKHAADAATPLGVANVSVNGLGLLMTLLPLDNLIALV